MAGELIAQLIVQLVHLVVLPQVLANLRVAVLVVRDDDIAGVGGGDARLAVVLPRQIALPVALVLSHILDAKREAIVNEQRFACKCRKPIKKCFQRAKSCLKA